MNGVKGIQIGEDKYGFPIIQMLEDVKKGEGFWVAMSGYSSFNTKDNWGRITILEIEHKIVLDAGLVASYNELDQLISDVKLNIAIKLKEIPTMEEVDDFMKYIKAYSSVGER